ncbi:MAG TPA: hypothetical protein VKT72_04780 [Candidatus Baltobacteraceae bacterium]|nr:hypothetical protein [Candidatus Baltobacteraceae bacterium]
MTTIDRYLAAVQQHLPESLKDRQGVVDELADAIQSDLEDRQALLGRALSDNEVSQFIKGFGHPRSVAARYSKQHGLIDPEIFPFYVDTLTAVLSFAIPAELLVFTAIAVATRNMSWFWDGLATAWQSLLLVTATVTIIFAVLERLSDYEHRLGMLGCNWDPRRLPASYPSQPSNVRSSGFADFFFNAIALLLLLRIPSFGVSWLAFVMTPPWYPLYVFAIAGTGTIALAGLLTLAMPSLIRVRDWTGVAVSALLIIGCAITLHNVWPTSSIAVVVTLVAAIAVLAFYASTSFRSAARLSTHHHGGDS